MSNSNLSCSATNCVYNNASLCYDGGIVFAGSGATSTSATACASFEDRSASGMTSSATENSAHTKTSGIACQAYKCDYNQDSACKAPGVQINAQTSSCETFILK